jgi:hypothetical protein
MVYCLIWGDNMSSYPISFHQQFWMSLDKTHILQVVVAMQTGELDPNLERFPTVRKHQNLS